MALSRTVQLRSLRDLGWSPALQVRQRIPALALARGISLALALGSNEGYWRRSTLELIAPMAPTILRNGGHGR